MSDNRQVFMSKCKMSSLKWSTFLATILFFLETNVVTGECFSVRDCIKSCTSEEINGGKVCAIGDKGLESMSLCDAKCGQFEIARNESCTSEEDDASMQAMRVELGYLRCTGLTTLCSSMAVPLLSNTFTCWIRTHAKKGQCLHETWSDDDCHKPCKAFATYHAGECTKEELEKAQTIEIEAYKGPVDPFKNTDRD